MSAQHAPIPHLVNTVPDLISYLFNLATTFVVAVTHETTPNMVLENVAEFTMMMLVTIVQLADADSFKTILEMAKADHVFCKLMDPNRFIQGGDEMAAGSLVVARPISSGKQPLVKAEQKVMHGQTCGNFACRVGTKIRRMPGYASGRVEIIAQPQFPQLLSCAKCKRINDCSKECQKAGWKLHKLFCGVERIPQPEEVGLGADWTSEACQLVETKKAGGSTGLDIKGFGERLSKMWGKTEVTLRF